MALSHTSAEEAASPSLILWRQGAAADAGPFLASLENDGSETTQAIGLSRAEDLDELEQLARDKGDARILLVYTSPVALLCRTMAQGGAPDSALHRWSEEIGRLLAFLRRNRRRTVVADERQILGHPQVILDALNITSAFNVLQMPSLAPPSDPILQLVAEDTLRRDQTARSLFGELEASAWFGDSDTTDETVDVQACFARYQQEIREKSQMEALTEERQVEHDAVLQQLLRSQELAEERRQENERLNAQLHQLRQGMESQEAQLRSVRAELEGGNAKLAAELEARHRDVKELAMKLEAEQARTGDLSKEVKRRRAEVAEISDTLKLRNAKLNAILAQKSYRWTAPLRRLRTAVKRRTSL